MWSERRIAAAISRQTMARKCLVLVDNCNWTGHECDVLGVTTDLRIIDVEVKISRADLKADAKKDKWWSRRPMGLSDWMTRVDAQGREISRYREQVYSNERREWPTKVWKHYYALPRDIWKPELLDCLPSKSSGVLLLSEQKNAVTPLVVHCERRATPNKDAARLKPEHVIDIARLANLRMWAAYDEAEMARRGFPRITGLAA